MVETVLVIALGMAAGIAAGKALDSAPVPSWVVWGILAGAVAAAMYFLLQ